MAFSKADRYELDAQRFNELCRAISHPARQKILKHLNRGGPSSVKELSRNHPISKAALSYHLEILRTAHLVKWEERFPLTIYELNWEVFQEAKTLLIHFFDGFERNSGYADHQNGEIKSDKEDERVTDLN